MISKSKAGTTFDRTNWDVRVANKIFMDNEPSRLVIIQKFREWQE